MVKLCFIDVETTGLKSEVNGIIQIAGQIVFGHGAEYNVIETFNFSVKPFPKDIVEHAALKVNNITEFAIQSFPTPEDVFPKLLSVLNRHVDKNNFHDKFFFVGFNASFDDGFMREFFLKNSNKEYSKYFYRPALDVLQLALFKLKDERSSMPNFKLKTVANFLNISAPGEFHDAMTDILITKGIYFYCINSRMEHA